MRKLITRLVRRFDTSGPRADETTGDETAPTKLRRPLPDPKDFEGRPIIEYLRACGVPEDTSRYTSERGITTAYFRVGRPRRAPRTPEEQD